MSKKANKQQNIKSKGAEGDNYNILHAIAFWGLAVLLFLPTFFRGLFFAPEQEKALLFAALVFWLAFLWRWLKQDGRFLRSPLDWFALALPLVYIIASFTAVNKGLAIDEVVKNFLYFLTYWSVSRLVRNGEDIHKLLHVIYLSAIGVALAGLATTTGVIHINDGFSKTAGYISSTLQYHNALASFLGGVFLIGIYLWQRSCDCLRQTPAASEGAKETEGFKTVLLNTRGYLYTCGNFLLLAVLFGSKSRGGLLVFGLAFILYLIGIGNKGRLNVSIVTGYLGAVSYFVISKFISLVLVGQNNKAWLWVAAGMAAALAGQAAFGLLDRHVFARWGGESKKFLLTFAALAAVVIVAGGIWAGGKPQVIEKVTSPTYLKTAFHRLYYVESAVDMIKERPLIGWGGGGWKEAYESFLSYRYTTREAHSYYFQVGVETGIIGILVVLGIWVSFLYSLYRLYYRNKEDTLNRNLAWLFAAVFLMIGGHALIDFDLSESALTLVLWSIFGMAGGLLRAAEGEISRVKQPVFSYVPIVAASVGSLLLVLVCTTLLHASKLENMGVYHLNNKNTASGVESLEKAVAYNPFNANYRIALSQVYSGLGKSDKAMAEARTAVDLSRYSFAVRDNYAKIALVNNENETAVRETENCLQLAPNNVETYEQYAQNYINLGVRKMSTGQKDAAREYFVKAANVIQLVNERVKALSELDIKMWSGPKLAVNDRIQLLVGQAYYLMGNTTEAQKYWQQASRSGTKENKGQALVWLAVLQDKSGQQEQAQKTLAQAGKLTPDFVKNYESLKKVPTL